MKTILLEIEDSLLLETELIISTLKVSNNQYINDALEFYNKIQKRKNLENQLKFESALVKNESINVLKEFENLN